MKKLGRLEGNKEVRRVLNRHGVDLSYCQYSVIGMEIRMTGNLSKSSGAEFNAHQIESMIQDLQRHLYGYHISGDFDNWKFSADYITNLNTKEDGTTGELGMGDFEDDYDSEAS